MTDFMDQTVECQGCNQETTNIITGVCRQCAENLAYIHMQADLLVKEAAEYGVILTIEQVPFKPLSMRNYGTTISTRLFRNK